MILYSVGCCTKGFGDFRSGGLQVQLCQHFSVPDGRRWRRSNSPPTAWHGKVSAHRPEDPQQEQHHPGWAGADVRQRHGPRSRSGGTRSWHSLAFGQSLVRHWAAVEWRIVPIQLHQHGQFCSVTLLSFHRFIHRLNWIELNWINEKRWNLLDWLAPCGLKRGGDTTSRSTCSSWNVKIWPKSASGTLKWDSISPTRSPFTRAALQTSPSSSWPMRYVVVLFFFFFFLLYNTSTDYCPLLIHHHRIIYWSLFGLSTTTTNIIAPSTSLFLTRWGCYLYLRGE